MKCETCRFFREAQNKSEFLCGDGTCHANPPTVVFWDSQEQYVTMWPDVYKIDFCGRWEQNTLSDKIAEEEKACDVTTAEIK